MERLRLAQPELDERESAAIARVLAGGMLVQGALVERFEAALAARCGRRFAVAVTNGTAALEVALECLDLRGAEVLVPGLSWPSPAHAARRIGAEVALVDVDAATWNARPAGYLAARSERSRGAIVIDQFGAPAEVAEVAGALGLSVVEDAACAIGSHRGGAPCGSLGTISTLSFHPRKVVTTGEGGALLTDEPALAERARWLRNHGQRAAGVFALPAGNLRLTEMQAAMGLVQLEKLDGILAARRALGAAYDEALAARGLDVTPQAQLPGAQTNRQTYGVRLGAAVDRDAVIAAMGEAGIECGRLSYALGTLPSLAGARRGPQPVSEELVRSGLALPLHTRMREVDVARVVAALARALDAS